MFAKYARAISDKNERSRLHALYLARNAFLIVGVCMLAVACVTAYFLPETDTLEFTVPEIILLSTFFLFAVSIIAALVFFVKFKREFSRVLQCGDLSGESEEVKFYRETFVEERKSERKAAKLPTVLFALCAVIGLLLLMSGVMAEEESGSLFFIIGVMILLEGILILFFWSMFWNMKRASAGETFEQRVSDESAVIDAEQGRSHKYKLSEDKNAQKLDYLFPDESIRVQVATLRRKHTKRTMIFLFIGLALSFVIFLVFLSGYFFEHDNLGGYFMPLLIGLCIVSVFLSFLSVYHESAALEKAQYAELRSDVKYEANLRLFELYRRYDKTWARLPLYIYGASFLVSLVLAIIFPDEWYSILGALPVFAALVISVKSMSKLRQKAQPIEAEIDALNAASKSSEQQTTETEEIIT